MRHFAALASIALLLGLSAPVGAAETVVLTTLDWPPYTSVGLPGDGISSAIVSAAFAAEGVSVTYVFLPWNRAIDAARHDQADGFFPAYARVPSPPWIFSGEIGIGPIYFMERKDSPIRWATLDDLRNLLIGVDAGYVNTTEIDRRIADGRLHVEAVVSDMQNLKKLEKRRIDLAIIDSNVFHFLTSQPGSTGFAAMLRLEDKPLEDKQLFVDFRNTPRGRHFRDLLNRGLIAIHAATGPQIAALQARLMPR